MKEGVFDGIGIALVPESRLTVIDLDGHIGDDGILSPEAQVIIDKLNSYTEISQSGKGFHIFVEGVPKGTRRKNAKRGVEMYADKRFVWVTGNIVENRRTIKQRQAELDEFYTEIWLEDNQTEPTLERQNNPTSHIDDDALLARIKHSKQGHSFKALFAGDVSKYGSQSEADLALAGMLLFWTGGDMKQADRIFRRSGLMRSKWDERRGETTYGGLTLQRALLGKTEFYEPGEAVSTSDGSDATVKAPPAPQPEALCPRPQPNLASRFADLYSKYTESPWEFLYFGFLTVLGVLLSHRVTLSSELRVQPRLYTILLGISGLTRKSSSIGHVLRFFSLAMTPVPTHWGFGSAEGIAKFLKDEAGDEMMNAQQVHPLLLVFDEMQSFVEKANARGSTAAPTLTSLFEENHYANSTKQRSVRLDGVYVSMLAASTVETFEAMWTSFYRAIGFLNRLWLVKGTSERRFALPRPIPAEEKQPLVEGLKKLLAMVGDNQLFELELTDDALQLWERFYAAMNSASVYAVRLDTYGLRLMPLIALCQGKTVVDVHIVSEVINLLEWQFQVRQEHDPLDSDSTIAKVEGQIRKALARRGKAKKRELQKAIHYERVGIWAWETAITNLMQNEEVGFLKDEGVYYLLDPQIGHEKLLETSKLSPSLSPGCESTEKPDRHAASSPTPYKREGELDSDRSLIPPPLPKEEVYKHSAERTQPSLLPPGDNCGDTPRDDLEPGQRADLDYLLKKIEGGEA